MIHNLKGRRIFYILAAVLCTALLAGAMLAVNVSAASYTVSVAAGGTVTTDEGENFATGTWTSANGSASIATYTTSSSGLTVTGVSAGTVTLTHTYQSGRQNNTDTYTITVTAPLETIDTVDSLSNGININLFDYDQSTVNNVTNYVFYFGGSYGSSKWNLWQPGYGAYQGIVASTLGTDGYPTLAVREADGTSLSYLFGTTTNNATTALTGLNHLFSQEIYDETGYYEYYAGTNFATIANDSDSNFTVYSTQYNPSATGASDPKFLPFNTLSSVDTLGEGANNKNYFFGMSIDFSFIQPKDGMATWTTTDEEGNATTTTSAMIFEFTGDDDVWVFIDDVLVLDLGGIHDAVSGTIDFSTGTVTVSRLYGEIADSNTTYSLYELMKAAGKSNAWLEENFTTGENGNYIFADYTTHTFNYYYLERGAGGSNCRIRFNLQSIPTGTINFQKNLEYANVANAMDIDFEFKTYVNYDGEGNDFVLYTGEYEIYDASDLNTVISTGTATDGVITLKHNQVARLISDDILATSTFYVVEVGATSDKYDVSMSGVKITQTDEGTSSTIAGAATETLTVNDNPWIVFNNSVVAANQFNLRIDKEMAEGQTSTDRFSVQVMIGGTAYTGTYSVYESDGTLTETTSSTNGVITLKSGQYALITGLMGGSSIQVTEVNLNGDDYLTPTYTIGSGSGSLASSSTTSGASGTAKEGKELGTNPQIEVVITNTLNTVTLTIDKTVTGNMGDTTKDFSFTLTLMKDSTVYTEDLTASKTEQDAEAAVDMTLVYSTESSSYTFTLKDNEEIVIVVPYGYTYTVTEANYGEDNGGYTTTVNNSDGNIATGTATTNTNVSYVNHKSVPVDTGVVLESIPYIAILAVVVVGGVVLLRRRGRDED